MACYCKRPIALLRAKAVVTETFQLKTSWRATGTEVHRTSSLNNTDRLHRQTPRRISIWSIIAAERGFRSQAPLLVVHVMAMTGKRFWYMAARIANWKYRQKLAGDVVIDYRPCYRRYGQTNEGDDPTSLQCRSWYSHCDIPSSRRDASRQRLIGARRIVTIACKHNARVDDFYRLF